MERTGHRSLEGVRSYKKASDEQREALSKLLNQQPAEPSIAMQTPWSMPEQRTAAISTLSASHTSQLHSLYRPSATFNNCTVNFYVCSSCIESDSDSD